MSEAIRVGKATIPPGMTHRRTYETAAWFTDYAVPAGEFEVVAFFYDRLGETPRYWQPCAFVDCTVTDEFFSNRLFSAYTPDPNNGKNVGKIERVAVPIALEAIELDPAFRIANGKIERIAPVSVERAS